MCAIAGVVTSNKAVLPLYEGLTVMQHRGQDAAGIATINPDNLYIRKAPGLIRDVFRQEHIERLQGNAGIGHCRYPTSGETSIQEIQPLYVNAPYGLAVAHNGNLINTSILRRELTGRERRHLNSGSDSEVLLNVLAYELDRQNYRDDGRDLFEAVASLHRRCQGAYAAVVLVAGRGLLAFRDPNGIRPLVLGKKRTGSNTDYMVASESVALDGAGFKLVRDIDPGEAIFINYKGRLYNYQCAVKTGLAPCIFEYIYFARPDSVINGISVYEARVKMGEALAKTVKVRVKNADCIMPVPDSGRIVALSLAKKLRIPYLEGFIKNHYIGRTFIMSGQKQREHSVRRKLNVIPSMFKNRHVVLVEDSIVRGTTSKQVIQMAREAGASKVTLVSAAPPIRFPNIYGIDMPTRIELIAHKLNVKEIAQKLEADLVIYQSLEAMVKAVGSLNPVIKVFDTSCFDGKYVTGLPSKGYLKQLELIRTAER